MKRLLFLLLVVSSLPITRVSAQVQVTAMSYNIRLDVKSDGENQWENRKHIVATQMNYYGADFIGMQEVLHHQLQYLRDSLEGYSSIGVGRDDGAEKGEYSCIFYREEKFELVEGSTFWLSPTPGKPSKGWDAALNRVCTYGLFQHRGSDLRFWVFNTHFDHMGKQARLESAKLIVKKIQELNDAGLPVILMGDFNAKPDEAPAQYLHEQMDNARHRADIVHGPPDTWNGFRFSEKPNGCIDYIFVSNNRKIKVEKFATITDSYDLKYPSDHFPVMATLQMEE
jgi:endonuclease/exonuclease/phosphatase family metal-dependent hydrolase